MPAGQETRARAFYGDLLSLRVIPKPEPLRSRGGCWFEGAGFGLHLGIEADFKPAKQAHPAFRVDDLDALYSQLEQAHYSPEWDTALPDVRRFYVYDPFGNRLEFMKEG